MTPNDTNFESQITAALERKPQVYIPASFAASILAALPAGHAPNRATRTSYATPYTRRIALAAIVLLTIALIALPLREPNAMLSWTSMGFLVEMVFACELMALALWPGLWPSR